LAEPSSTHAVLTNYTGSGVSSSVGIAAGPDGPLAATSLVAAGPVISPAAAATGAFAAYSQFVLSAHPTAFYALNERAGSTAASDLSGNGNDGVYTGTLNYGNPGVFADGSSSSIGVNGDAGWVAGPSVVPMAGGADRTVELWFKGTGSGTLFHGGQPGHTQSFDLTVLGGGPGGCNSPSGPGAYLRFWDDDLFFPASNLADGNWHYLAVTVSGSGAQVAVDLDGTEPAGYVWNGSCYTTSTVAQPFAMPFPLDTPAAGFGLAQDDQTGLGGWVGNMALVAIYPTALAEETLDSHFVAGTGSALGGPVGGPLRPSESYGGGGLSSNNVHCNTSQPVDCATGNFWHTFTDLIASGRGLPLDLTRTYNAQAGAQGSIFGQGWSSSYDVHLSVDGGTGDVTVAQENGTCQGR
jgi:hypothetical protein